MNLILCLALVVTAIATLIGYIKWKVSATALAAFIVSKGYMLPSDNEMQRFAEYAVKKLLHLPAIEP